eukprot:8546847-Alexandrium_andersonii.AAC.1
MGQQSSAGPLSVLSPLSASQTTASCAAPGPGAACASGGPVARPRCRRGGRMPDSMCPRAGLGTASRGICNF